MFNKQKKFQKLANLKLSINFLVFIYSMNIIITAFQFTKFYVLKFTQKKVQKYYNTLRLIKILTRYENRKFLRLLPKF